ncbi:MAG: 4-phosphopantetheinyl transferase family protein, partial [Oxalobacter sp.]|nr:4-phosphopantetheinyl transferase family protein [Oxalobacter sp.]
ATSTQKPVGLDIEWMDDSRDVDGMATLALLENERQWLKNQPPEQKNSCFYMLWTRKEACYKCLSCQVVAPEDKGFYRIDSLDSRLGKWESWIQAPLAVSVFKFS